MHIDQPRWKVSEYTKRQINDAGGVIRRCDATSSERAEALKIVDNWRSAHAYPLHVFYMNLLGKIGAREDILVVERLKRLESSFGYRCRTDWFFVSRSVDSGVSKAGMDS